MFSIYIIASRYLGPCTTLPFIYISSEVFSKTILELLGVRALEIEITDSVKQQSLGCGLQGSIRRISVYQKPNLAFSIICFAVSANTRAVLFRPSFYDYF